MDRILTSSRHEADCGQNINIEQRQTSKRKFVFVWCELALRFNYFTSVCQEFCDMSGGSLSEGGLCPRGSLSRGVTVWGGVSVQRSLSRGVSVQRSLSRVVSVQGVYVQGVSVQGYLRGEVSVSGALSPV